VSQGPQAGSCGLSGGLTWGSRRPSSPGAGPGGVKARRGTLRHRSVPRTSRRRARFEPRGGEPVSAVPWDITPGRTLVWAHGSVRAASLAGLQLPEDVADDARGRPVALSSRSGA